jgi:hypothetical protein
LLQWGADHVRENSGQETRWPLLIRPLFTFPNDNTVVAEYALALLEHVSVVPSSTVLPLQCVIALNSILVRRLAAGDTDVMAVVLDWIAGILPLAIARTATVLPEGGCSVR